jgi:hypothetical protein
MSEETWMERAVRIAGEVYGAFLEEVVEVHVLNDREEVPLGQETNRKLEKQQMAHPNAIRLLTISGKGGYTAQDGNSQKPYARFYNITLLDHLLSTVRGAIVFAVFEWLSQNPEMDTAILLRKLRVIAVIAFLHDLDKDLKLPRNMPLTEDMIRKAIARYGLDAFLAKVDVHLEAAQIRYLIEKVEASQAHLNPPKVLPPREFESLPLFVRLADQLDGIWCLDDPEQGGLVGVLKRIRTEESVLRGEFLKSWKAVRLFDPHHPFLLDELQRRLSRASVRISGVPPLIETHRDGELFMLLPEQQAEAVIEKAVRQLCEKLPFGLTLVVSAVGVPSLYNEKPSHERLVGFIASDLRDRDLGELFKIKTALKPGLMRPVDDMLGVHAIAPRWPKATPGALVSLYSTFEGLDEGIKEILQKAAHLVLMLNLKVDAASKSTVPGYNEREATLLELVAKDPPDWIAEIGRKKPDTPDQSRRTLTALWVTALAREDRDVWEAIWGEEGLLKRWLEGEEGKPGMREYFTGRGDQVTLGLERRLRQLLGGTRIAPEDETNRGHCLFTGEPTPFDEPIKEADGLYGVKVAAFSGREGRPELITSERAHTVLCAASVAEHKLRAKVHESLGGVQEGVPALVSSPTTSGLFGGLALREDRSMAAMSVYDLNRLDVKKGRIIRETDIHRHRFRMARLERMPEKLTDQVNKLRMLLRACRRIGRPIHVLRGLPMPERSYFFYDAMPQPLVDLLGMRAFRLEQLPAAIKTLEMAQLLLETRGLGYDAFRRYVNPTTCFGAICLAWCEIKKKTLGDPIPDLIAQYRKFMEENKMSEQDGALVRFGQAAASIQQRPSPAASANEELMVFKVAMDAVTAARRLGQVDEASLVCAVAGELETNLSRRDKTWLTQPEALRKRCLDVAALFVRDVWLGALKGKTPSQGDRRVMASIYRMAFVTAHRK